MEWHAIVRWGQGPYRMPPRGPYRTRGEAEAALDRYAERMGSLWGTIQAAHSVRVYGPYPTRDAARRADISERP